MNEIFARDWVAFGVLLWLCGCAGSARDDTAGCTPGETRSCVCANDASGEQSCNASGTAFADCECSARVDAGAAGRAGGAGVAGTAANQAAAGGSADAGMAADRGDAAAPSAGSGGAGHAAGAGGTGAAGKAAPGPAATALVTEPDDDATYVFDQSHVRTYNIAVDPADLAMIDEHPAGEAWIPAQLEFEGTTYGPIKMRYKGSDGAFSAPCTKGDYDDPKDGKCSIKLGFDEVDPELRFYGLKKLNFHSMNHDSSMLRDRLGYSLYRDSQVAAPRAVHAKVLINGELEGLYIAVEQVDGRFTRARFAEGGEGNIYKEKWISSSSEQDFIGALESNTDMPDVSGMLDFQTAVQTSTDATQTFVDRAYMMRWLAVDRVIVNDDGPMHFYCDPNSPPSYLVGNGNYYWYQSAQAKHFWLIPWDLDLAFDSTPWVTIYTEWSAKADCTCKAANPMYAAQMPPSCDALVKHFIDWHDDYEHAVDDFINGPFSDARVEAKLEPWIDQIQPFVTEAAGMNGAPSVMKWMDGIREVRDKIASQRMHRGYAY
jgi:hypothetical protein